MDNNHIVVIVYHGGKARRFEFHTVLSAEGFIREFLRAFPEARVEAHFNP